MIEIKNEQGEAPKLRQVVDLPFLANHFDVTTTGIRNWVDRGEFPKPIRLGRRLLRWDVETINTWIEGGCPSVDKWEF